jgi:hypothetical protein
MHIVIESIASDICVRGNMDSIAICILRCAICILQKILGNIDLSTKPFWFRKKESILHRNMHIAPILHVAICILRYKSQHAYCNKKNGNFKSKWANLVKHIPRHPWSTFFCKSHHHELLAIWQSHHQHIGEVVWGVTMVVHALTWTLSSWFGRPLNAIARWRG